MTHLDSDRAGLPVRMGMRWGWFGTGLVIAGVVAAGWGHALRRTLVEEPSGGMNFGLVVAAGTLVALAVALVRLARMAARPEQSLYLDALASVIARVILAAVVVGPFALYGLVRLRRSFAGGLPEPGDVLFGIGMTFVAAGLFVLGRTAADLTTWSLGSLCAGLLTVAAVAQMGLVAAVRLPVEAVTVARTTPAATPVMVSKVAWQWRPPDGGYVREAVAAGGHVVVRVSDGVVALDPATGRERWHYRRPGAASSALMAAPDGGMVAVEFGPRWEAQQARERQVMLNAYTGEVRSERAGRARWPATLTSYGFVTSHDDDTVVGWGLLDAEEPAWSYRLPRGCSADEFRSTLPGAWHVGLRDVVALPALCGKNAVVIALNPQNGDEVWRYERPWPYDVFSNIEAGSSADGHTLWVKLNDDDADGIKYLALAQDTGQEVFPARPGFPRFDADGYLTVVKEGGRETYRWEMYGGGGLKTAEMPTHGSVPAGLGDDLPLKDGVLVANATVNAATVTIKTDVAAWGTTQPRSITFDMGYRRIAGKFRSTNLLPVAGSVVIVFKEGDTVTGLR
ncbi:PQQ-binding-like beta-propeller repeat protein [Nonomuraea purpurea]|uniref:PQQ-binding-like beta-propeller repeat protein n=1 Tax=Nonomuraea purpurea TaxID=1849276 RepID=A0ABV8GB50_9ACTN